MHTLLVAFAMVLIIEGIGPLLFPNRWQLFLKHIAQQNTNQPRSIGGVLVTIGVVCLFMFG
ncbi:MAG: DUF2065 domain-containing protein [Paraglaciecola sp.]|nr:DUF2065 domain-containing protein [Paraglaciecola sp.]NCT48368.1 DUF2065 domain-containing protein [Paraglaciecola sp.]